MKYRKKTLIEAYQLVTPNPEIPPHWLLDAFSDGRVRQVNSTSFPKVVAEIATLEGLMTANENDWIARGVKGELYPIKAEIFTATYEAVE